MATDFLRQISGMRDGPEWIAQDGQADNLPDAERALQELAEVFLQHERSWMNPNKRDRPSRYFSGFKAPCKKSAIDSVNFRG